MSSNTNKEEKKDLGCEYHEICEKCGYPEMKKRKKKSAPQPEKQEKKRSGFMFYSDMPKEEIEDTIPEKQDVPSPNPLEEDIICKCSHYHSQHSKLTTFNPNYTAGTCKMNCRCKYFVHDPDYPQAPNCEHKGKCVDGSAMGCSEWEMSIYYKK